MKVLIVGASGMIGGEVLSQCLAHPDISHVIAFVRRDLPEDVSSHPKLQTVIIKDFANWPEDVLQAHADASAMIWNMGSYKGSITADLEYPMAFLERMATVLETRPVRARFRYVHLSGRFVRQNQEEKLWFLEEPRKIKGLLETKALEFAKSHDSIWETFIVKPGGVATRGVPIPSWIVGAFGCIRIEEVGAFMTYLAINGKGEDSITENARMVTKGRELLAG